MVVALVTGGNTGIGEAAVRQLAKTPDFHVIIGSRSLDSGNKVADTLKQEGHSVSAVQLDISSDESIAKAIDEITKAHGKLDVLVNNAGVLLDGQISSTRELFSKTFNTNVFGTAALTEAALPLLQKSDHPRVIFVSSTMGSLEVSGDDSTPFYHSDYKAYDASKAAVNMLAINYARILKPYGGVSNAVCPGLVKTRMNGYMEGGTSVDVGAQRIVELATSAPGGPTGTFSNKDGSIPW
ncbi:short chain dehydrogenase family [Colletotrichum truncatum]|uniref:Short chain dehydrogenase family n=1 Tax=Colletotrichum truncatum TaxID=5467 RepID=A0ACC3ZG38_COLTU|nr:short chain dehydrogenase family [Colletotrichum truncatum]KAF6801994.1 short chain dehydrogenase family [Colletotrichum truncatum]